MPNFPTAPITLATIASTLVRGSSALRRFGKPVSNGTDRAGGSMMMLSRSAAWTIVLCASVAAEDLAGQYNQGIELYQQGKFAEAGTRFRAASVADNSQLAAQARYNLGNTHYARAVAMLRSQPAGDPDQIIDQLRVATTHYFSALRLHPDDRDARANVELAGRLIDQLEQQKDEQRQEEQPQDDQQQGEEKPGEQPDQPQSGAGQQDDHDSPGDESTESQAEQEQDSQPQSDSEQQSDADRENKPGQNGQTGQPHQDEAQQEETSDQATEPESADQNESDASGPKPPESNPADREPADSEPADRQPNQSDSDSKSMPQSVGRDRSADQPSDPANSDLGESRDEPQAESAETPRGQLSAQNQTPDDPSAEELTGNPGVGAAYDAEQMTEQEAEKLLQLIRDRDMLRRMQRESSRRSRRVFVPRDW